MRFLLNNLTAVRRKTGIGHYVTELVRCLRERHDEDQFVTFPGRWAEVSVQAWDAVRKNLHLPAKRGLSNKSDSRPARNVRARGWADWYFRTFWSRASFDLYHEPNYIPFAFDGPTVVTVHDLSVLLHPEWHPPDRVEHYAQHFEDGLRRCAHLLVPSEFTRHELIKHFRIAQAKVTCTPLGIRADLRPLCKEQHVPVLKRLGLHEPYLLHVGTIEPRKNLLMLMQAYGDLPGQVRERCPLVLAGGWGWNVEDVADHYQHVGRHRGVRHLGYVADADLPALYSGARALVFPSHYEGFGLPPLEMLACGGPVVASTAGAVAEIVGGHACLVHADDLEGWRAAMQRIVMDDDWRESLRRDGPAVARPFSWQQCADKTFRVYSRVLGLHTSDGVRPMRASA